MEEYPQPTKWELFWRYFLFLLYCVSYLGAGWLVIVFTHKTIWSGSYSNLDTILTSDGKTSGVLWLAILGGCTVWAIISMVIYNMWVHESVC